MDILNLQNIAFFAMVAPIVAFWKQIQGFILRIVSIFIRTDKIEREYDTVSEYVVKNILKKSKVIKWGNRTYSSSNSVYIKKLEFMCDLMITKNQSIICLYKNRYPIKISSADSTLSITYFSGTLNLRKLIMQAEKEKIEIIKSSSHIRPSEFTIQEHSGRDYAESAKEGDSKAPSGNSVVTSLPETSNSLNNLFILEDKADILSFKFSDIMRFRPNNEVVPSYYWSESATTLLREVNFWNDSKKWFSDRGMVHKRGSCVYGPPGTGKSKMVLEVAKKLGIAVTKLNVSNMTDNEFSARYNNAREGIVLLEDFDIIFQGRTNVLNEGKQKNLVSFDTILNCISGISTRDGKFTIITTNKIDTLDKALIRPGRLDTQIFVGNLDFEGMNVIAKNILHGYPEEINKLACKENDNKYTAAEFEQMCIDSALNLYWNRKI